MNMPESIAELLVWFSLTWAFLAAYLALGIVATDLACAPGVKPHPVAVLLWPLTMVMWGCLLVFGLAGLFVERRR